MKKLFASLSLCLPIVLSLSACQKKLDYFEYVSEYRKSVYFYEDDVITLKIYSVDKETNNAMDGYKGNVSNVTEVYFESEKSVNEAEIELLGQGGEMSYLAVTRNFYLSFSGAEPSGASIPVTLKIDGEEKNFDVMNVAEEGTIDGKTALKCVVEYDKTGFDNLTEGRNFSGEISVRLLYDEGCFYYVGVCNREKQVHAYLVDGVDGRIIAERESEAE